MAHFLFMIFWVRGPPPQRQVEAHTPFFEMLFLLYVLLHPFDFFKSRPTSTAPRSPAPVAPTCPAVLLTPRSSQPGSHRRARSTNGGGRCQGAQAGREQDGLIASPYTSFRGPCPYAALCPLREYPNGHTCCARMLPCTALRAVWAQVSRPVGARRRKIREIACYYEFADCSYRGGSIIG
jgi:hypothetical protein